MTSPPTNAEEWGYNSIPQYAFPTVGRYFNLHQLS
jgi:hypothetical protein